MLYHQQKRKRNMSCDDIVLIIFVRFFFNEISNIYIFQLVWNYAQQWYTSMDKSESAWGRRLWFYQLLWPIVCITDTIWWLTMKHFSFLALSPLFLFFFFFFPSFLLGVGMGGGVIGGGRCAPWIRHCSCELSDFLRKWTSWSDNNWWIAIGNMSLSCLTAYHYRARAKLKETAAIICAYHFCILLIKFL